MAEHDYRRARGALPAQGSAVWWFLRRGRSLATVAREAGLAIPDGVYGDFGVEIPPGAAEPLLVGYRDGQACLAVTYPEDAPVPEGLEWRELFRLFGHLDDASYAFASYAYQITYWQATSAFCPVCGGPAAWNEADWGRTCTRCGHIGYPRVSPCSIGLIHDGGRRVLLVRQAHWARGVYSLVAGFVEPAESLEDCFRREVREEVGVEVDEVTYVGSQPWSFPHQLMVGFTARYAGGEIAVNTAELEDARWFDVDALPPLPPPQSIARRIIEGHVRRVTAAE